MSDADPTPVPPEEPAAQPVPESTKEERTSAMLCHLLGLVSVIGPLVLWLIKKDESPLVDDQGKESVNFQITVLIAYFVAGLTCFLGVGVVLVPVISIGNLVLIIIAAVRANEGERYRYPICLRLIN